MNETQLIANIATAREQMQLLIERNAPLTIREQHERLINSLRKRLADRQF